MLTPLRNPSLWRRAVAIFLVGGLIYFVMTIILGTEADEPVFSFRAVQKTIALAACLSLVLLATTKDPVDSFPLSRTEKGIRHGFVTHFIILFLIGLILCLPLLIIAYIIYKATGGDIQVIQALGLPISFLFFTALFLSLVIPFFHRSPSEDLGNS